MTNRSLAFALSDSISTDLTGYESRSEAYGSLVGQMIQEIGDRLELGSAEFAATEFPANENSEDFLHAISVACGYGGLALALAIMVRIVLILL